MTLLEWARNVPRHLKTFRPFGRVHWRPKGVGLGARVLTVWDKGSHGYIAHANTPLWISLTVGKVDIDFGVIDKPVSEEGAPEWMR